MSFIKNTAVIGFFEGFSCTLNEGSRTFPKAFKVNTVGFLSFSNPREQAIFSSMTECYGLKHVSDRETSG